MLKRQDNGVRGGVNFDVHQRAQKMLADGYAGEGMSRPDIGADAIVIAACDPDIESGMDERGYALWWIIDLKYRAYLARKKLGVAQPSEVF